MQVKTTPFFGAKTTVEAIRSAALQAQNDFNLRALAEQICGEIRPKDYLSEALALYNFVEARTRYMRDPRTVELVKEVRIPVQQLMTGQTPQLDCDDMAALLAALILVTGGSCRIVTVAFKNIIFNGEQQYSHVFVQFLEPKTNTWITLDPVAGRSTNKMLKQAIIAKVWPIA